MSSVPWLLSVDTLLAPYHTGERGVFMPTLLPGDILLFEPDKRSRSYLSEEAIVFGESLEYPGLDLPFFCHVGIALSADTFAEEDGTAHKAKLADISATQPVYAKRLALTDSQRSGIPAAAAALYGTRYDMPLDFYLGVRYLWHGCAYGLCKATGGLVRIPDLHIGEEEHHRLICSTFDKAVLADVGYRIPRRFPSPEYYALLPGPLWRLQ